jgi:Zn-dependent protease/predicted transcriptional regulator
MRGHIRLGRVAGVEISLHYTWFVIAVLITVSLVAQFHFANPEWSPQVVWVSAIVTGILFFGAIVVHELAHSLVAKAEGLPVHSITLFALGGVSQIGREAGTPGGEFWMAIAGPIASAVIGVVCLLGADALGWSPAGQSPGPVTAVLGWLGYINIGLAVFNMIPGFPLDGGRVLRAIVWRVTGSGERSTKIAARVGQAVAFVFIFWGLFRFVTSANIGSLWLAFIGWFLLDAALASYAQAEALTELRNVHVGDVMARDCAVVDSRASLQDFAEQVLRSGQRCFLVEEDGRVAGLVTLKDVRQVPRDRWTMTPVGVVMRPLARLHTVSPETPASEGLEIMSRENVNQLPVVSNGHLDGVVSRNQIIHLLHGRHTPRAA